MNPFLRHREQLLCVVRARIWVFVSVLLWGSWQSVFAAAPTVSPYCTIQKLTEEPVYSPSMDADGTRIGFSSLSSESESNPWSTPQYTESFFLVDTQANTRTQLVSHSFEGRAYLPTIKVSASGERVVFTSSANPVGENSDGNREIFLFEVATKTTTQITKTTESIHSIPVINDDGTRIAFISDMNPTGENTDYNTEIFLFDTIPGTFTQITHTTGFSPHWSASISADGTQIALASSADLTGSNPDGTLEIFLWDATAKTFTQITNGVRTETTSGNSLDPVINADGNGTRIVFQSTEDFTGENSDHNGEIFLFDTQTNTFTQITHTADNSASRHELSISADGTRIVFAGPKHTVGNVPDDDLNSSLESEVFLFDSTTNTLTQITRSNSGSSGAPTLSANGTRIAFTFISETILVGADLRGYEWSSDFDIDTGLFVADCAPPDPRSPSILAALESPEAGTVSGLAVIRGWAVATQAEVEIDKVTPLIDGVPIGEIPCCSERADVRIALSEFPATNTFNSGWGTAFNWGILPPGPHRVRAQIRSTAGELFTTEARTVTVIKPGDFEYLDQFSLADAGVRIQGNDLLVEGVLIRDQTSQQQKRIDARFRWSESSQSFGVAEAITTGEVGSLRSVFSRLLSSLSLPLEGSIALSNAQASVGIQALLENPEDNQSASGVTVLRGWAFPEKGHPDIAEIQLLVDGQVVSHIPCCSERADVAAAFPDDPRALLSGWGMSFNYGLLSAGRHTIGVRITDATGASFAPSPHTITVVRPGGFEFLDQFDLSAAQGRITGQEILLEGVQIRDKATQKTTEVDIKLRWLANSQTLAIVSSN